MNKRYIPLLIAMLFLVIFSGNAYGQRKQKQNLVTIESVVLDESGNPIPNAIISGKEGAIEAKSGADGKFSISVPENSDLLIEAKGYEINIVSSALATKSVTMTKAPFLLDETSIVNIPFRKIKAKETVGALSVVNPKDFAKYDNSQYLYDALRSRVPGMLGNTNIRGIGTAVFIVDGVPRDASNINIEEIEQITVLKDGNAAMMYGTMAKNGVILVTTKRGQAFKRKINATFEQGMSKPIVYPKYLKSSDYMSLNNEAYKNDGLTAPWSDSTIAFYAINQNNKLIKGGNASYRYPSVDYYSPEFLKDSRPFTKFLTEFSGGNAITQYYANMGWMRTGTLYKLGEGANSAYNRFNVRANVNLKVNDFIDAYLDAVGIFSVNDNPNGAYWSNAATLQPQYFSPLIPVSLIQAKATMTNSADKATAKRINNDYILGGTAQYANNLYGNMYMAGYSQDISRTATFNQGLNFNLGGIIDGLKFKTYLSFDIYNVYNQNVTNTYAVYTPTWKTNPGGTDSISSLAKVGTDVSTGVQNLPVMSMNYIRRFGTYALLDYNKMIGGAHSITATMVGYFDQTKANAVAMDDKHGHLALRVAYDYKKKYLLDFTGAYVNGYKLQKGSRGAFSPSLGLAWVLSEDLLPGSNIVNYLKLRASASIMNVEYTSSDYKLWSQTWVNSTTYAWYDGARTNRSIITQKGDNPNLTMEQMKNINVGLEGYFFNNALYLDGNIFSTNNTGIVTQQAIYGAYLFNNKPYENFNETNYRGAEIGFVFSKTFGDFSFDLGGNFLYAMSTRKKVSEIWANDYLYRQNQANDVMFGLEAIGLFADQADINNSPSQKFGEYTPGDIKYKDQNGDGRIDSDDQFAIGNSQARNIVGVSLNLKYKSFSLYAIGNGREGAEAYYNNAYYWNQGTVKYSEEILNRWTPATKATATYPRLTSKNSTNNFQNSTFWIYDDNYFTLDRVQLTYVIPGNLAKLVSSKDISVYLRGENLVRFSKDADKRQMQFGAEPLYRNYALGVRMMF